MTNRVLLQSLCAFKFESKMIDEPIFSIRNHSSISYVTNSIAESKNALDIRILSQEHTETHTKFRRNRSSRLGEV